MKRLRKHTPLLKALASTTPAVAKEIIEEGDKDLINTLCECGYNVLKGNVPLTPSQKKRLQRHKYTLRALVGNKRKSLQYKKELLQKGGFLGALLAPLIGTVLSGVLGSSY